MRVSSRNCSRAFNQSLDNQGNGAGAGCRASDFGRRTSDLGHQASDIRHQILSRIWLMKHQTSDLGHRSSKVGTLDLLSRGLSPVLWSGTSRAAFLQAARVGL